MIRIETYSGKYDDQIVELVLGIQNGESALGLTLEEQPELRDIGGSFRQKGGEFWIALDGEKVVGTLGLIPRENACAVMKKFFVAEAYRSKKTGLALYTELIDFARKTGIKRIILDTPAIAHASHRFYDRAGFRRISYAELPIEYTYPDRGSWLYMLELKPGTD